jgi:hypothetical protein
MPEPKPALRFQSPRPKPIDPLALQRAFDQQDWVDAVRQVELGWQLQYETYYEGKVTLTSNPSSFNNSAMP